MTVKAIGDSKLAGINLERCSDAQEHELGLTVKGQDGNGLIGTYRYVQFKDAVTYVAGHFCNLKASSTSWTVTNDISGAMAGFQGVGVVFQATVPTENQYGWVQCGGIATVLIGSASVIAGDWLKNDGTTDGALDEASAGTDEDIQAQALATIGDTATGLAMLRIRGS